MTCNANIRNTANTHTTFTHACTHTHTYTHTHTCTRTLTLTPIKDSDIFSAVYVLLEILHTCQSWMSLKIPMRGKARAKYETFFYKTVIIIYNDIQVNRKQCKPITSNRYHLMDSCILITIWAFLRNKKFHWRNYNLRNTLGLFLQHFNFFLHVQSCLIFKGFPQLFCEINSWPC